MINPIPADEYIYENENARIIMKNLIQKIPIKKDTVITEKMAIQIYDALINNYPKRLEINDQVLFQYIIYHVNKNAKKWGSKLYNNNLLPHMYNYCLKPFSISSRYLLRTNCIDELTFPFFETVFFQYSFIFCVCVKNMIIYLFIIYSTIHNGI